MLIKGNLRTNVTHELGNLDVEASTATLVDMAQNFVVTFNPEMNFKKQVDMVV